MPPVIAAAAVRNTLNLSSLLQALPSASATTSIKPQSFTKCSTCLFSTTNPQLSIKKPGNKKRINDPYRAAQARQRKAANQARQSVLQEQRKAAMGDPVRSQPTPFIQSLKSPSSYPTSTPATQTENTTTQPTTTQEEYLNFFLKPSDMAKQISHSKWLTEPIALKESSTSTSTTYETLDATTTEEIRQEFLQQHENAERALQNITSLDQGSSKDKTRLNIQRCIEQFGRHNTDTFLPSKPSSTSSSILLVHQSLTSSTTNIHNQTLLSPSESAALAELSLIPKRVGRDTGSSEVQAAILTAKINVLAENLQKKDKHNKRALRLLVHRRQKHLAYLRRKERGGPRWEYLVEKLGINDAMWKGEISL